MESVKELTNVSHLQCSQCDATYAIFEVHNCSPCCKKPLVVKYTLSGNFLKTELRHRVNNMWRYFEMLPVLEKENIVCLGEGMTPLLELQKLGSKYNLPNLWIKDESQNPTGSFKARGLSVAVSKAKEFGIDTCIIPTAGNAGAAMSAYCASAGIKAIVVMPRHTPQVFKDECELFGAELILVNGLISDCATEVVKLRKEINCFDMSTLKEPYRLEGKKTMGYELAEQFNWKLPDVILYPTGGGTGLIGIWKAFHEMIQLKWIGEKLPRMIAVQAENCQPCVQTWKGNQPNAKNYVGKPSIANGLAVPHPFGEDMIMKTLRESNGFPIAISDEDMIAGMKEIALHEGLLISPEGGAIWKALLLLIKQGVIERDEKIVLLNTGAGYKYLQNLI